MNLFDSAGVTFQAIIPVYLIIGLGWLSRRLHWILPSHEAPIARLALEVCYPCLVLSSMLGNEMLRDPLFSLMAASAGFGGCMMGIAAAWLTAWIFRYKVGTGLRTFTLAAGIQNYSFFAIPIIAVMYTKPDNPMMGILMTHNVGCEIAVWTVGLIILSGGFGQISPKIFLRGPLIGVALGLVLAWTGWDRYLVPAPVKQTLQMLGNCAIPLCVLIFGTTMYDSWKRIEWSPRIISSGIIGRLMVAPALMLLLAWLLPVPQEIREIMIIQAAIPSAMVPALIAKQFGGQPGLALQICLVTTFVSFATLPLWLAAGFYLIS